MTFSQFLVVVALVIGFLFLTRWVVSKLLKKLKQYIRNIFNGSGYKHPKALNKSIALKRLKKLNSIIDKCQNRADVLGALKEKKSLLELHFKEGGGLNYGDALAFDAEASYQSALFLADENKHTEALKHLSYYAVVTQTVLNGQIASLLKEYLDKSELGKLGISNLTIFLSELQPEYESFAKINGYLKRFVGQPWYDEIKQKKEPEERFQLAKKNLPLPAAFREAKIAVRAMIRIKRKNNENYGHLLSTLYKLAATESMILPYSEYARTPGFNIACDIWQTGVLDELYISYKQIGYEQLDLGKTDIKWMVADWGEPDGHSTMNKIHYDLWHKYEKIWKKKDDKHWKGIEDDIKKLI